jgi:hypothetical protein
MKIPIPFLPVIVITAYPHQFSRAAGIGIDALMEKPLDLPLLLQPIRGFLAEPEPVRVARLIDPNFTTLLLSRLPNSTVGAK